MHPALSVIFFTVTSGAGFGFMAMIGLGVPLPESGFGAFLACVLAGGFAVAGLISSTFHLGHPERAWRAFSQWRSSWLSREGVLAVGTLSIFALYGFAWVFYGFRAPFLGVVLAIASIATVFATAMIYAQLKTVPSWSNTLTPVCYILFAVACGVLLAGSFGFWKSLAGFSISSISLIALAVAWIAKFLWWNSVANDTLAQRGSSAETATGLGFIGKVRLLEKPHSGENYLTKEMVHQIGRKHANKLRLISLVLGAIVPLLVCLFVMFTTAPNHLLALAFVSLLAGLFVERWLFFAEAKHAVSLYY